MEGKKMANTAQAYNVNKFARLIEEAALKAGIYSGMYLDTRNDDDLAIYLKRSRLQDIAWVSMSGRTSPDAEKYLAGLDVEGLLSLVDYLNADGITCGDDLWKWLNGKQAA